MSNRDKNMFRQEQRFSFRKYSFGLASALIANVVFGATIAGAPVVHANTETEATIVTSTSSVQSETVGSTEPSIAEETVAKPEVRNVSLTYTVKVVDKEGAVLRTEVKTVDVTTEDEVASVLAELGEDLVPTDYKLIAGLGQVQVLENQDNVFTVTVEKVVAKQISETPTATASENAISSEVTVTEGAQNVFTVSVEKEAAATPAEATATTAVQPEVATIVETPASNVTNIATVSIFAYEVNYTTAEGEVVGKTANIVAADSPGATSQEITVSASDIPTGYELAAGQLDKITAQLVANQVNILSFAVVKKSEEEEIAASQLANKDILEQVTSEADLLADEALRLVATTQADNAALEAAAQAAKAQAAAATAVLNNAAATAEEVDAQIALVRASSLALADELLKVDADGVVTSQLSISTTGDKTNVSYVDSNLAGTEQRVRLVSSTVSGQTITYVVEYNIDNGSGYGAATHTFGLPKGVIESSVRIVREQRSDSTSMWVNDGNFTASDYPTYPGSTDNRTKFTDAAGNIRGGIRDFREAAEVSGTPSTDIQNIYNGVTVGSYYESQMAITTRAYRYTITATLADGYDPEASDFVAGFLPGTGRDRWYTALIPEKTDRYNITWDNQSVAGRNDAGFELVEDADGNRVLVYKYDLDNATAFTTNDVLKQLNATPKSTAAGLRTLDGTEKAKIEAGTDGYTQSGNVAQYNGQTIDFLDVVNPNPLWGGRPVVSSTTSDNANYSTFYIPNTTNPGSVTHSVQIGGTNGVGNITLTDNARDLYTDQVDRQKLYIRSTAASYEAGSGSAVDRDTDTDTIPVYFVGYRSVTNQAPTVTDVGTAGTQLNSNSPVDKYLFVFGTTEGTTEIANGSTSAAPTAVPANATATVATWSDPENATLTVTYDDNAAQPKTQTSLGSNLTLDANGKLQGTFEHTAGGSYTRRVKVTDPSGSSDVSNAFYTYAYTDKVADATAIAKNEGVALTETEIFNKLAIATTSTAFPVNGTGQTVPTVPNTEYTRTVVGYKTADGTYTEAGIGQLPTTGDYKVKVRTRNIYGQDIYNWVSVNYNEAPDISPIGTDGTQLNSNSATNKYLFVFGITEGTTTTSTAEGATTGAPEANKANATATVATWSDPEGSAVTISYDDNAAQPKTMTSLGSNLTLDENGKLQGSFVHRSGGSYTRRVVATDAEGARSASNAFYTYAYTDQEVDTTPISKDLGVAVTEDEVFAKLAIAVTSTGDTTSTDPAVKAFPNTGLDVPTIPTSEYTRTIVGYRPVGSTTVTDATVATLPTSGQYEVVVRTRNIYGQDIYNWVTVNYPANTPTTATDKQTLYLFNNTPIATVNPGTNEAGGDNKVKVATLEDPEGIQSVANKNTVDLGYEVDTEGNVYGTPKAPVGLGAYSSSLIVTDNTGATTEVFSQSPTDNRYVAHIMDVTVTGEVDKAAGQKPTEAEILEKVSVNTGTSNSKDPAIDTRYRKVLAPGQTVPTTPGRHEVTVRVITDSNVYKDVVVVVN
ncbi:TPA: YSIRK-type signal peptide-containing protein, partial [Streptococcus suis]